MLRVAKLSQRELGEERSKFRRGIVERGAAVERWRGHRCRYRLRDVAVASVVVSRQKFNSDSKDAAKGQDETELHTVVLMVEHFRNEIGQGDAQK